MHNAIHGVLHLIEVADPVKQRPVVDATHERVYGTEQNGDTWIGSMDSAFAEVKETCKGIWGDEGRVGVMLHLLIATSYSIGTRLSNIVDGSQV